MTDPANATDADIQKEGAHTTFVADPCFTHSVPDTESTGATTAEEPLTPKAPPTVEEMIAVVKTLSGKRKELDETIRLMKGQIAKAIAKL